jgi:hypothetical protein
MKKVVLTSLLLGLALVAVLVVSTALAGGGNGKGGKAKLNGWQETPAIFTDGSGSFRAMIQSDGIHYTLRYEDLGSNAAVAHIHFGQRNVAGGVIAFLCGGQDKPACPAREGEVTGVIDEADVMDVQGIDSLSDTIRALRKGFVYANVHTATFGGGEIRGQVKGSGHGHIGKSDDHKGKSKGKRGK